MFPLVGNKFSILAKIVLKDKKMRFHYWKSCIHNWEK